MDQNARRDELGSIAGGVVSALQAQDWDASVLGRTLGEAARGAQRSLVVRFEIPDGPHELRVEPSARLPGIAWSYGGLHWRDDRFRTVRW